MVFSIALAIVASATAHLVNAAPFSYPLANGFPKLSPSAIQAVYTAAGGTLPNGPLPSTLTAAGTQTLQLIAANELFEVAYFTDLLHNITTKTEGYTPSDADFDYDYTVNMLTAVVAQEQVHVLAANGVLANANQTQIQPCQYQFPVTSFKAAITLAQTFTDVVLGVLPLAQTQFATDGGDETALIQIVGSIIAQEGEQNGFYRQLQNKVASAAPLLTGGAPQFAYTALSQFFVEGSCPNIDLIGLTAFPALNVVYTPEAKNMTLKYSVAHNSSIGISATNTSMTFISGQNLPVTVPISNVYTQDGLTYYHADFPYAEGFARGLTLGALTKGHQPSFNSSAQVAAATLYGPALIEVD